MRRRGIGLVEILLASAVLAFALIPVFTMTRAVEKTSSFGEYHLFWQLRATRVLQRTRILPYPRLVELAAANGGRIPIDLTDPPLPPEYLRKLRGYEESLRFEEVAGHEGLGILEATMAWSFPLDGFLGSGGRRHRLVLSCLVLDTTRSLRAREELRL